LISSVRVALELLGALFTIALELLAPVDEREMQPHARLEHLGVDRLHDVVDRAELEALDLRLRLGLAGEEMIGMSAVAGSP